MRDQLRIAFFTHNRELFELQGLPIGQKGVVSLIEGVLWALWLLPAALNAILAVALGREETAL